jgi:hypothetical protein
MAQSFTRGPFAEISLLTLAQRVRGIVTQTQRVSDVLLLMRQVHSQDFSVFQSQAYCELATGGTQERWSTFAIWPLDSYNLAL